MLILCMFMFLCTFAADANKDKQQRWKEHISLCRSPTSYTEREDVSTAQKCKNICGKARQCLMVRYDKELKKCWLCDNKSLRPSTDCSVKHDFYIKVLPTPKVLWIDYLQTCKQDQPYKMWFMETANECKNTCAEEERCKMVKYSPEERKCFFSSSVKLKPSSKCEVKYNFYTKAPEKPGTKWIVSPNLCRKTSHYGFILFDEVEYCKERCTDDEKCAIAIYSPKEKKCWTSSSLAMKYTHSPKCLYTYDFYQKDVCAMMKKTCKDKELCMNNGMNHTCLTECPKGYYAEDQICQDVNECNDNSAAKSLCGKDGECFNLLGGYTCTCGVHHKWNGKKCIRYIEGVYVGKVHIRAHLVEEEEVAPERKLRNLTSYAKKFRMRPVPTAATRAGLRTTRRSEDSLLPTTLLTTMTTVQLTTHAPTIDQSRSTKRSTMSPKDFLGLLSEHWLSHPQLCLSMPHYEIFPEVLSEMECRWHCEQQKECVMVAYDPNSHKCWLSSDLKMTPKTGCDRLLDYYIKGRNECKGKRGRCHRNAVCRLSKEHRTCQCVYGFEGDGWSCKDIDECSYYNRLCGQNAKCVNTAGGYSCKCDRGFKREGGRCGKAGSSVNERIIRWKLEHSSGSVKRAHVTSILILISKFLLA